MRAVEDKKMDDGERIRIRDPSGASLHRHLIETRPALLRVFPQLDPANAAPSADDGGWLTDKNQICEEAPVLELSVMEKFYEIKLGRAGVSKVWGDAYKRMLNRTSIPNFRYHPPTEARPSVCWIQCSVPASMKALSYPVSIALEFMPAIEARDIVRATPRLVANVLCVRCTDCIGGGKGEYPFCIHGATVLFILYNLPREDPLAQQYVP